MLYNACAEGARQGNLKSNEQQKVETQIIESKSVIVVEQSNPQVVYVPLRSRRRIRGTDLSVPPTVSAGGLRRRNGDFFGVGVMMARSGAWLGMGLRMGRQ
jgi:hypothetical protein